jgi:SSS family solute:Na+ symporter/sodium/pantothenate symporter
MNPSPDTALTPGFGALLALLMVIAVSVWIGTSAQRVVERGSFLKGYFLGNRGLGVWALALTATVQSGGSFMGFPSLVYSHGWIVALWIASYMVVPLMAFGIVGKRIAQLSRRTGAITVPDLFRERFASPAVGIAASVCIIFALSVMMIGQFKAGAIVMKIAWPTTGTLALAEDVSGEINSAYYLGLIIFALTVVGYTLIGGFLASVWTDLFQSVLMLVGIVLLFVLALPAAGGLQAATLKAVNDTSAEFVFGPGYGRAFLPLSLSVSYFFFWAYGNVGSPAGLVRVMATNSTQTLRRSCFVLGAYNTLIYLPLVAICIAGRAILPNLKHTDEISPRLAILLTHDLPGGSFWAGVILAAPFGAVMATVSTYLVVISSGLVRDIYQRVLRPAAGDRELRYLTYSVTVVIGVLAIAANIFPVKYLQALVVFSSASSAAAFVVPGIMTAFWRRATAAGAATSMLIGAGTVVALFLAGMNGPDPGIGQDTSLRPYYLLGLDPIVWGLLASLAAGVSVSCITSPPDEQYLRRVFDGETMPHNAGSPVVNLSSSQALAI